MKKMSLRRLSAIAALSLSATGLVVVPAQAATKSVTLEFWNYWDGSNGQALKTLVAEFNKNNPMVELLVASIRLSKIKNNKTFTSFAMEIECLSPEKLMNNLVEKFELNNPNSFPNMLVNAFEKTGISVRRFFKDYVLRDILLDETGIITGRFSILILYIIKIMKLDSDDFKKITFMLDSFLDKIKYNNNTEFNDKLEDLEKLQIQLCRDIIKNLPKNNNAEQKIPRKKQNFLKKIYRKYMTDIPDWI